MLVQLDGTAVKLGLMLALLKRGNDVKSVHGKETGKRPSDAPCAFDQCVMNTYRMTVCALDVQL